MSEPYVNENDCIAINFLISTIKTNNMLKSEYHSEFALYLVNDVIIPKCLHCLCRPCITTVSRLHLNKCKGGLWVIGTLCTRFFSGRPMGVICSHGH